MVLTGYPLALVVAGIILNVLAISTVAARVVTRRVKTIKLGLDDLFIVMSLLFATVLVILGCWQAAVGLYTRPLTMVSLAEWRLTRQVQLTNILIGNLALGFIKLSVLHFYKRLFPKPNFRWAVYIMMGLTWCWIIGAFFAMIFSYWPVHAQWTDPPQLASSHQLFNVATMTVAHAAINIGLDIIIIFMPLTVIGTLNMKTSRKILLGGVFMLASFCLIASIVRLYYVRRLTQFSQREVPTPAFRRVSILQVVWIRIEVCVSVVTACLPTLSPLYGGVRSIESVLASVRSVFSLSSRSQNSASHLPPPGKFDSDTELRELSTSDRPSEQDTAYTTTARGNSPSVEDNAQHDGIRVQKSFVMRHEQV